MGWVWKKINVLVIGEEDRNYVYPGYRVLFYYKIADSHPAQMSE